MFKSKVDEAAYVGNIGAMEMFKFYQKANNQQKEKLQQLIQKKDTKAAWKHIQSVTNVKLHKSVYEEHGAGEEGTDALRKKYQEVTPGQKIKSFSDYVKTK
jgi:molybdenum-dependent DNA-binding transcriptional regulator ModE